MDAELSLVIGIVMTLLAFPTLLQHYTHGTAPRAGAILLFGGIIFLIYAVNKTPGGYSWDQVPDVFVRVIGRYLG